MTIVNQTGFQMKCHRVHLLHGEFADKPTPDSDDKDYHYFPESIENDGQVEFEVKNMHGDAPVGPAGYVEYYVMANVTPTIVATVDFNQPFGPFKSSYEVGFSKINQITGKNEKFIGSYILDPSEPAGKEQTVKVTLMGTIKPADPEPADPDSADQ